MNCEKCKESLVLYLEDLLDQAEKEKVAEHVGRCQTCQAEHKHMQDLQNRLVTNGNTLAQSDLENAVMNQVIREQNRRLKATGKTAAVFDVWRIIMKSNLTKLAVAAVIVIACVLGVSLYVSTSPGIAIAKVLAKVEQINAYMYRTTTTLENETRGDTSSEGTVIICADYGMKTDETSLNLKTNEQTHLQTYFLPHDKVVVMVNLGDKEYARVKLDDATLENAKVESRDPREMLKRLLACEYKELGKTVKDGVEAQGFETTDPALLGGTSTDLSARLWVSVDTWLPVRWEIEMQLREGVWVRSAEYDYQWNIAVDAGEFEPYIPEDFTANQMDGFQMPSYSEQGCIEALQLIAEFIGRYPEKVDTESVAKWSMEIGDAITQGDTPAARQFREMIEQAGSKEKAIQLGQQRIMKITSLPMFHVILSGQQKDPAYHGDVVTPDDADLPLMRWKVSDNEYRVIFGDLHAETVTAEVLAELEAVLPQ